MYLRKLGGGCIAVVAACLFATDAKPGASPDPVPPREGVIVVTSSRPFAEIEVFTPDGKSLAKPWVGDAAYELRGEVACPLFAGRLSPNGKRLAATRLGPFLRVDSGPWTPIHLWVFDLESKDGSAEALAGVVRSPTAAWSPDGTKLYVSHVDPAKDAVAPPKGELVPMVCWVYDFATKRKTPLALPSGHAVMDVSPDGKSLLTVEVDLHISDASRSFVVPLDTLKPRLLAKDEFNARRFSPDGKWVLGNRAEKDGKIPLVAVAVAGGAERSIPLVDGATWALSVCWSPDGKRIAYNWLEEVPPPPGVRLPPVNPRKFHVSRVTVADADGRNAKTIIRDESGKVMHLDWR
jgi:Tol biopolymer transport system component